MRRKSHLASQMFLIEARELKFVHDDSALVTTEDIHVGRLMDTAGGTLVERSKDGCMSLVYMSNYTDATCAATATWKTTDFWVWYHDRVCAGCDPVM